MLDIHPKSICSPLPPSPSALSFIMNCMGKINRKRNRKRERDRYIYIYIEREREREREGVRESERERERERKRERKWDIKTDKEKENERERERESFLFFHKETINRLVRMRNHRVRISSLCSLAFHWIRNITPPPRRPELSRCLLWT